MPENKTDYISGVIVKGISGFWYVDSEEGYFECRARGSFRNDNIKPLVGDKVLISTDIESGKGTVEKILPRKNVLLRPPVANVTQMAVVLATANPKPNLYLTDKVLASAKLANAKALICVNKTDIENADEICDIYKKAGYTVIPMSAKNDENIDILRECLKKNVTVFAGNSGVGKSSILNKITGLDQFETGEVSKRVERGRHTTRHSELVKVDEMTYIIDTPGFGNLDMSLLNPENCAGLFIEFEQYIGKCRFIDCNHTVEPGCAVLEALENGDIEPSRHNSYIKLIEELKNKR